MCAQQREFSSLILFSSSFLFKVLAKTLFGKTEKIVAQKTLFEKEYRIRVAIQVAFASLSLSCVLFRSI
jgi:hypothetical protein